MAVGKSGKSLSHRLSASKGFSQSKARVSFFRASISMRKLSVSKMVKKGVVALRFGLQILAQEGKDLLRLLQM